MKLTKAQEKRFDEKFVIDIAFSEDDEELWTASFEEDYSEHEQIQKIKQHLANELSRQKKEIIEKLEKLDGFGVDMGYDIGVHQVIGKDQAIKEIE